MATLNKVLLIGNLTRDVELRTTQKGTAIAQFGLAVNRQFKDETGATKDEATFVDIEAWGKQAELVSKYLAKGSQCLVEGRLKFDQWEDKTTQQKRSRLKVVLENVQFLGGKKEGQGEREPHQPEPRSSAEPTINAPKSNKPEVDEDVPF
jgi:single-strand DNA-binding protein